jgi:tRNA A37 methylthiotransferase MiaB
MESTFVNKRYNPTGTTIEKQVIKTAHFFRFSDGTSTKTCAKRNKIDARIKPRRVKQ